MDVLADDFDMWNFMKNGSHFDNISAEMKGLFSEIKSHAQRWWQATRSCENFLKFKAMVVKPGTTVADIKECCQQNRIDESWAKEFLPDSSNYTIPSANTLDCDKACKSLLACYDKAFLESFGVPILFNSVCCFIQSFRTWRLISSFIIPEHERLIGRTREKLDECARICTPMINLEVLNSEQVNRLQRVQELMTDIKDAIHLITEDINQKIAEAKRIRSNCYCSALVNGLVTILNGSLSYWVGSEVGRNSYSAITIEVATVIQAGCTIGELIHAGKADLLVKRLQEQLLAAQELEAQYNRVSVLQKDLLVKPQTV